jgi:Nif-specific regulatory protein
MSDASERSSADLAIEEAYALALDGRPEEAVRLLDAVDATPARRATVELARARCLLAQEGKGAKRGEALLESLAAEPGPARWQARLSLARRLWRTGDVAEAARLVQSVLEALRRSSSAGDGEPFPTLLSLEVEHLQQQPGSEGTAVAESSFLAEDLLALIDLGRRLGTRTDPTEVLRTVLHEAIRLTDADRGFVVLADSADGTEPFEFAAAENLDRSAIDEPSFEVSRSLIREVSRTGRVELVNISELPDSHPASRSLGALGVRAVACVPLEGPRGIVGVLYLDARKRDSLLRDGRRPFLELLASQTAAAVENAQTHREAALTLERAEETIRRHRDERERRVAYDEIVGVSPAMQAVYARLDRIVPTSEPVIILGETGTGKELAARLIHERGPRSRHEFVAVNCAGLAESLLEGELFGHERGAFTGASRSRAGLLEVAHRGTLFLDEIADMPPRMQGNLLRTLQSGEVRRVGGRETIEVDVRVVAASNRDLDVEVKSGRFRADLYFRLNVLKLMLPPLRDRVEDVPLLVERLLPALVPGRAAPRFTERAMARLAAYPWPGNVRELQNVLRRIAVAGLAVVDEPDLPAELLDATLIVRAGSLQQAEDLAIRRAMQETDGNKSRAAKLLGVDRKTLYTKLRRLGLH